MRNILLLSSCLFLGCTSHKIKKVEGLLEKEKWGKAQKKIDKLQLKSADSKYKEEINELYIKTLYHSLNDSPSVPRLYAYLNNYPLSQYSPKIEALLYEELANVHSENELILLNYSRSAPNYQVADKMYKQAENIGWSSTQANQSSNTLHSFLLRYPNGSYSKAARELESNLAFEEALEKNNLANWSEFIRKHPSHPKIEEAKKHLREVEWLSLRNESSPAELWQYAEKFSGTNEGWKSAVQAFRQTAWTLPTENSNYRLSPEGNTSEFLTEFELDFHSKLPIGFSTSLQTLVKIDEDWIAWEEALDNWTTNLYTPVIPNEERIQVYSDLSTQTWKTPYALCSLDGSPLEARLCAKLNFKDKENISCKKIEVNGQCAGAQQMIFSTYEDDIVGPISGLEYSPQKKQWTPKEVGPSIPEEWTCTHIYENTPEGMYVVCGEILARIGWEKNKFALQASPKDLHQMDRVTLEDWSNTRSLPWTLKDGKLLDQKKQVLFDAQDRNIQLSPALLTMAFAGPKQAPSYAQKGYQEAFIERLILPKSASLHNMLDANIPKTRTMVQIINGLFGEQFQGLFGRDIQLDDSEWITAILITVQNTPVLLLQDSTDWMQYIPIPLDARFMFDRFYTFKQDGDIYLRMFGQNAAGEVRIITLYKWDGGYHLEAEDIKQLR